MGILSQIIPGLRDARTPSAVGALWALTAWLASSFAPPNVWEKDFFAAVGSQVGSLPVEVAIGGAAFLVYLIGVVMQSIGSAITRFAIPAIFAACGIVIFLALLRVLFEMFVTLVALAVALSLFISWLRYRRLKSSIKNYWAVFEDTNVELLMLPVNFAERKWREYLSTRETRQGIFEEIALETLEQHFTAHPGLLEEKVHELPHSSLHSAAVAVGLTIEEIYAEVPQEAPLPANIKSVADLRLHLGDADKYDIQVRPALIKKLKSDREALAALMGVLDLTAYRGWLRRNLERADHELRSKPELFLEYDRMRAEGEFRSGISFPLAALVALAGYKWHLLFNSSGPMQILWGLLAFALLVWIVVNNAGSSQQDEARRLLHVAVRNKTLTLSNEIPFGEPIFAIHPLPEVRRAATVRSAAKERIRIGVRKPLQRLFPELSPEKKEEASPQEPAPKV
ncbi:hypothetical protein AB0C47_16240 [Micromonospora taraxaci]|uniref:hypothetical protein n=1 Tax=Micromonospora taraxaci TaxID=1316803 RepID=UPI0033FD8B1B